MENDLDRRVRERTADPARANDDFQAEIVERKPVEEDLRESEDRYRLLFENSIDGVLLTAPDGRILAANREACRIFGRTEEELCQVARGAVVDVTDPRLAVLLEERSRTGKSRGELTLLRSDGTPFEGEVSSALFTDRDGNPRTSMIVRDITERKNAEGARRASQQLVERTLASLRDAVFILDAATTEIVECNPAASAIFGHSREEMLGRTTALLHCDEAALAQFRADLYSAIEEKRSLDRYEFRMKRKDGTVFPTEHSVVSLEDERGKRVGWVSVVRDITERKEAEEALRTRTRHLEAIRAVTTEITHELNPTRLLALIIDRATDLVGASVGRVWLWDEEAHVLVLTFSQGPIDWMGGVQLRLGEGVAGTIAGARKGLIVNDYTESPYAQPLFRERGGFTAVMGEPLLYRDRLLGVLMVSDRGTGRSFSDRDHEILRLFATQAAIAIENARLFQSVSEQHTQLRAVTARLVDAGEMERQRLSRELHDCVGGNLAALNLNLSILQSQLQAQGIASATAGIEESMRLVEEAVQHIRSVMIELRPPLLDDQGLVASLRWYVDQFSARTSVNSAVRGEDPRPRLPRSAEIALFRIAQEVLTNVAKHAAAREVTLILEDTAEQVRLTISDDGVGFDPATVRPYGEPQGWGLITMRERAAAIKGSLRVETPPGGGTRVIVEVPR